MGLLIAISEFIFAIYSHSLSALMDAAYDASELIFVVFILFLTPLFHKPISEKRPYGFSQIESIFLIIKGCMMLSVTVSLSANVIEKVIAGGIQVDGGAVSMFQLVLGIASLGVFFIMKSFNRSLSSPTIEAELLGWRLDIAYSMGLSIAFFVSTFLDGTSLAFISPYFDQIMTLLIVLFTIPASMKMLWGAIKDVFLFAPDQDTIIQIKTICSSILQDYHFDPVFYDITRTGRRLWVAIYFEIEEDYLNINELHEVTKLTNLQLEQEFDNCTCELIIVSKDNEMMQTIPISD